MITARLSSAMLGALDGAVLGLHTAEPTATAPAELAGGSYARQPAPLGLAVAGERANSALIRFVNLPTARVSHVALWFGSSLLWSVPLAAPVFLSPGDAIDFEPGAIRFGVQ
jgi:hypothetical protein